MTTKALYIRMFEMSELKTNRHHIDPYKNCIQLYDHHKALKCHPSEGKREINFRWIMSYFLTTYES